MTNPTSTPHEPTTTPRLDVVVVTYCAPEYVTTCLRSVLDHAPHAELHVVDNASPDGTADRIAAEFPQIDLVRSTTNDGFAVANNRVLRDVDAPYALLLNPDARIDPDTVTTLVDFMERNPDIGVAGCRLLTENGTLDHAAKRNIPRPRDALAYFVGRMVKARVGRYTAPEVAPEDVADVDAVNGAFMLVRTAAMAQVGLLDERYWMYGEDLDWCLRFRRAGWRVVYNGTVVAHHAKGGSAGVRSPRLTYHFHRSMALFYRDHVATGRTSSLIGTGAIYTMAAVLIVTNSLRRSVRRRTHGAR